jgi:glycosyltransferase involved in cell wall biosynthesis
MKVVLLSTYGGGGAGLAARRQLKALRKSNQQVNMLTALEDIPEEGVFAVYPKKWQKSFFLIRKFGEKVWMLPEEKSKDTRFAFSTAQLGMPILKHPVFQEADIVHIHWVQHGFVSLNTIQQIINSGKKIVWTLHDEWVFTGGCHYTRGCQNYLSGCGICPLLKHPNPADTSSKIYQKKEQIFLNSPPIHFVGCSNWLTHKMKHSPLLKGHGFHSIPNPISISDFYPAPSSDRSSSKIRLLFIAQQVKDPRKGFSVLWEALQLLSPEIQYKIKLIIVGNPLASEYVSNHFEVEWKGTLKGVSAIREVYQSAEVMIVPSLEDNLPNTIMEAMACGLPVIGSDIGGIPEMIQHKITGWLAECGNPPSLQAGISWMLDTENRKNCGNLARKWAENQYAEEVVSQQWQNLYTSI